MINHEQLIEFWKNDCKFDNTKLAEELYRQPLLHAKYLEILQGYKISLRKNLLNYDRIKSTKTRYFNGEMSKEELDEHGWSQYKFNKPMKSQLETLIDADPDIQTISERIEYLKILIDTTESIMKEIHSRGFLLKTIFENRKFESGI